MRRNVLGAVFFTVLLDLIGFGMIFPLLPTYAADLGATPTTIGLLVASYSAAQLVFAPVLGHASDRWGRSPVVAVSALGAAAGYLVLWSADGVAALFLGRVITGLCAGNIAAAQATIADVTAPERRAQGMAVVGAGIGLGIVIGPALTALTVPLGGTSAPFALAAALAVLNAGWAALALPRTRGRAIPLVSTLVRASADRLLLLYLVVNLAVMVAFSQIESQLPLLTRDLLGFGAVENGYLFMYVGVLIVGFQLTGTRWLAERISDDRLVLLGLGCFALGALLAPLVSAWWHLLLPAGLIAIGNATQAPSLMSAISTRASEDEQGAILGASQSLGSSGRILGPVLGGWLFATVGPSGPYVVAAALFAIIAAAVVWWSPRLRRPDVRKTA